MEKHIDIDILREKIAYEVEHWKEKTANHYTIEAEARWSEANHILGILDSLQQEQREVDWDAFRREAAKTAMLGLLAGRKTHPDMEYVCGASVQYADELIKRLK